MFQMTTAEWNILNSSQQSIDAFVLRYISIRGVIVDKIISRKSQIKNCKIVKNILLVLQRRKNLNY